jgi:hypothetical protein
MKRSKKKQQKIIEKQDDAGISRKKWNHTINLNLFVILKLVCIVSIPIFYFVYSPVLVICLACYVLLFFLAIMTERRLNTSVIKSNHIKIPKFDSALALIVIVVAIFGTFLTSNTQTKQSTFGNMDSTQISSFVDSKDFSGAKSSAGWSSFLTSLKNFGSLLTGERSVFGSGSSQFGMENAPTDFKEKTEEMENLDIQNMPKMERQSISFSITDLPIKYLFSSILSTVNTALIFSVSIFGAISLIVVFYKKNKFETMINEVIVTDKIAVSDDEIDRILDFGVSVVHDEKEENLDKIAEKEIENEKNSSFQENLKNKSNFVPEEKIVDNADDIDLFKQGFDLDKIYDDIPDNQIVDEESKDVSKDKDKKGK